MADPDGPPPLDADRHSLFLDLDGTLVDIEARPEDVRVPAATVRLLTRLDHRLAGRLVVLTGRSLVQLDAILGTTALKAGAGHGCERRPGGPVVRFTLPSAAYADLDALAQGHPGVIIERKTSGVAIHYRACPDARADVEALTARIAGAVGASVQPGKMVVEIKRQGADKGAALRAFMERAEFAGTSPLMIGDDLTDEAAFAAAAALGGAGILVGAPRATAARF